jgi:murein L,D-transpeptidase YcbB/YkuD
MGMKTKTSNMILSAEAYKKFKIIGMHDVIKLDGGGSFHINVNGKAVASTLENRLINTIICFDGEEKESTNKTEDKNPYPVPTIALKQGNPYTSFNKWLQWQLSYLGFKCDIDGSFGSITKKQVLAFQKSRGLAQDGSVGSITRKALLS